MYRLARIFILLMLLLAGCSEGAVVFAPTPLPPEISPTAYHHPSGAFTLLLPRNWSLYEQSSTAFAAAAFAPPGSTFAVVQVFALNTGQDIQPATLGAIMDLYQTQFRPDVARYTEQGRDAMGDGSWRITGLRRESSGATQQINTFIQRSGSILGIIEIALPTDSAQRSQAQTILNTLELNADANLPPAELSVLSGVARVEIEVVNISTWTTAQGVFFVTGEVANHSDEWIANMPIRAILQTAEGNTVADALDTIMGYAIEPDGFAPFSIRFGQGQPVNALNYTVVLGSADYQPASDVVVVTSPELLWTEQTQYSGDGALFITGTIANRGVIHVREPRAIATVFDDRGRVIAAGFADADSAVLRANEETTFTILISDSGGTAANYIVNVQALPCDTSC